jgi:hypothetical protein
MSQRNYLIKIPNAALIVRFAVGPSVRKRCVCSVANRSSPGTSTEAAFSLRALPVLPAYSKTASGYSRNQGVMYEGRENVLPLSSRMGDSLAFLLKDSSHLSSGKKEAGHVDDGVAMELVTWCPHSVQQCQDMCSYFYSFSARQPDAILIAYCCDGTITVIQLPRESGIFPFTANVLVAPPWCASRRMLRCHSILGK